MEQVKIRPLICGERQASIYLQTGAIKSATILFHLELIKGGNFISEFAL